MDKLNTLIDKFKTSYNNCTIHKDFSNWIEVKNGYVFINRFCLSKEFDESEAIKRLKTSISGICITDITDCFGVCKIINFRQKYKIAGVNYE